MKRVLFGITFLFFAFGLISADEPVDSEAVEDAPVYVIPLREDVDRYLGVFLGRSLEEAEKAGAETVIFEIDTFGGRVDTALEIASKIGSASSWTRTVAYVPADSGGRGVSWSAGALMAFSASELWMAPGTSMGAAAPVYKTSEGMQAAGEKTVSAVRGQMAALAEKNGYPVGVALAMVDLDVVLKEVTVDGKTALATTADIEAFKSEDVDFTEGRTVSGEGKLLTLTAGEMQRYGVSSGTVDSLSGLLNELGYTDEDAAVLQKSSSDSFLTVLTSGAVTSLLLIIAVVALYFEITSPGFGIPGTIALICFAVVFGASGMMGNLGAVEILLFLAGVILLLLEIFVIPGFGIAGISGIILILGAFIFSMQNFYFPEFDWQWTIVRRSFSVAATGFFGGIACVAVLMALLPRAGIFDRFVLSGSADLDKNGGSNHQKSKKHKKDFDGPESTANGKRGNGMASHSLGESIVPGDFGVAVTDLRPVGKVKIQGKTLVAETDGEYYDKGTEVVVQMTDGVKTVVSAREED